MMSNRMMMIFVGGKAWLEASKYWKKKCKTRNLKKRKKRYDADNHDLYQSTMNNYIKRN